LEELIDDALILCFLSSSDEEEHGSVTCYKNWTGPFSWPVKKIHAQMGKIGRVTQPPQS
jgi:hypothetical protein